MAKDKNQKPSPQTQQEALKVAKATQRPGQTKEQTKLIAQGIEKGISFYKKQQKEKSRELNRKLNKASQPKTEPTIEKNTPKQEELISTSSALPWILLVLSWLGFTAFHFFQ